MRWCGVVVVGLSACEAPPLAESPPPPPLGTTLQTRNTPAYCGRTTLSDNPLTVHQMVFNDWREPILVEQRWDGESYHQQSTRFTETTVTTTGQRHDGEVLEEERLLHNEIVVRYVHDFEGDGRADHTLDTLEASPAGDPLVQLEVIDGTPTRWVSTYDARRRRVQLEKDIGANSIIDLLTTWTFTTDRIVERTKEPGQDDVLEVWQYTFDPAGRLVEAHGMDRFGEHLTEYVWEGNQLVEERWDRYHEIGTAFTTYDDWNRPLEVVTEHGYAGRTTTATTTYFPCP